MGDSLDDFQKKTFIEQLLHVLADACKSSGSAGTKEAAALIKKGASTEQKNVALARFFLGGDDGAYLRSNVLPLQTAGLDCEQVKLARASTNAPDAVVREGLIRAYIDQLQSRISSYTKELDATMDLLAYLLTIDEVGSAVVASMKDPRELSSAKKDEAIALTAEIAGASDSQARNKAIDALKRSKEAVPFVLSAFREIFAQRSAVMDRLHENITVPMAHLKSSQARLRLYANFPEVSEGLAEIRRPAQPAAAAAAQAAPVSGSVATNRRGVLDSTTTENNFPRQSPGWRERVHHAHIGVIQGAGFFARAQELIQRVPFFDELLALLSSISWQALSEAQRFTILYYGTLLLLGLTYTFFVVPMRQARQSAASGRASGAAAANASAQVAVANRIGNRRSLQRNAIALRTALSNTGPAPQASAREQDARDFLYEVLELLIDYRNDQQNEDFLDSYATARQRAISLNMDADVFETVQQQYDYGQNLCGAIEEAEEQQVLNAVTAAIARMQGIDVEAGQVQTIAGIQFKLEGQVKIPWKEEDVHSEVTQVPAIQSIEEQEAAVEYIASHNGILNSVERKTNVSDLPMLEYALARGLCAERPPHYEVPDGAVDMKYNGPKVAFPNVVNDTFFDSGGAQNTSSESKGSEGVFADLSSRDERWFLNQAQQDRANAVEANDSRTMRGIFAEIAARPSAESGAFGESKTVQDQRVEWAPVKLSKNDAVARGSNDSTSYWVVDDSTVCKAIATAVVLERTCDTYLDPGLGELNLTELQSAACAKLLQLASMQVVFRQQNQLEGFCKPVRKDPDSNANTHFFTRGFVQCKDTTVLYPCDAGLSVFLEKAPVIQKAQQAVQAAQAAQTAQASGQPPQPPQQAQPQQPAQPPQQPQTEEDDDWDDYPGYLPQTAFGPGIGAPLENPFRAQGTAGQPPQIRAVLSAYLRNALSQQVDQEAQDANVDRDAAIFIPPPPSATLTSVGSRQSIRRDMPPNRFSRNAYASDFDALQRKILRANVQSRRLIAWEESLNKAKLELDNMIRDPDVPQNDPDEAARKRRRAVWDDAQREACISGDRLYAFVRQLSGNIGEAVDAVCQIDEGQLVRQQQDLRGARARAAERAAQEHMQLVRSVFNEVIKESGLTLGIEKNGPIGELTVVSNTLRKQVADATQKGGQGEGFFSNAVQLERLLAQGTGEMTLTELFAKLQQAGVALQQAALASQQPAVGPSTSLEFLSAPRNSLIVRYKPEALAAVRRAFDLFQNEMRHHGGHHRRISAYELIEGRSEELCSEFAALCGHMLVHSRMFSSQTAMYISAWPASANATMLRISLQKLVDVACDYLNDYSQPSFQSPDGRKNYFAQAPEPRMTGIAGEVSLAVIMARRVRWSRTQGPLKQNTCCCLVCCLLTQASSDRDPPSQAWQSVGAGVLLRRTLGGVRE